jgi:transcriptional regulator with XRE-family HTH domain
MERAEVSQSELARRVGCTPGAVNQILSGLTSRSRFLPEMASALGVSFRWLAGETDDPLEYAPAAPELSHDEERLLEIYRDLPKKDRAALKLLLERMVSDDSSTK